MTSFGICCFKKEPGEECQVLLLRRRYTYSFCSIIYHAYRTLDDLERLLSGTSIDEKILLLSLDFDRIWDKVWTGERPEKYEKYKMLFLDTIDCSGADTVKYLIRKAPSKDVIWELPKGRKDIYPETEIECACREFMEETNIPRESFQIHKDIVTRCHYRDHEMAFVLKFWAGTFHGPGPINSHCLMTNKSHYEHDMIRMVPLSKTPEYLSPLIGDIVKKLFRVYKEKDKSRAFRHFSFSVPDDIQ